MKGLYLQVSYCNNDDSVVTNGETSIVEYLKPKVMKKSDRMLKIDEDPEETNGEMLNTIYVKVEQPQSNTVISKEDRSNANAVTNHEEAEEICSTVLADHTDYTMANTTDATSGYCDYNIAVDHNSSQVANLEINHKLSNISLSSPYITAEQMASLHESNIDVTAEVNHTVHKEVTRFNSCDIKNDHSNTCATFTSHDLSKNNNKTTDEYFDDKLTHCKDYHTAEGGNVQFIACSTITSTDSVSANRKLATADEYCDDKVKLKQNCRTKTGSNELANT